MNEFKEMINVVVLCSVFAFITGFYTAVLMETKRDVVRVESRQCVVKMTRGNETHVYIGDYK
jgi:uncharacterized membrane protein